MNLYFIFIVLHASIGLKNLIIIKIFFLIFSDKDKDKRPEEEGGIMEALSRPLFKKVPEDREVREGNTVRFDTLVSGRPAPELTWYRDDVQVHNDDQHKVRG